MYDCLHCSIFGGKTMNSPFPFFSELTDSRVERTKAHLLEDILFIAIASVICGAKSWNDMETFGKAKQEWLCTFLLFPNGIPSHDTFNHMFSALNSEQLESSFISWTRSVAELTGNEVIMSLIENWEDWKHLRTLIKIETERYDKCRQTMLKGDRLYISSLEVDAGLINKAVRSRIENSLHWVLDIAFNENHSRKRVRKRGTELLINQQDRIESAQER